MEFQDFKNIVKNEKRELTDAEYKEAVKLDWKTTCPSKKCPHYNQGRPYNPTTDPCIEEKCWLYVKCPRCGYDMSVWKMGVSREEGL
jgi:hypothetical protein